MNMKSVPQNGGCMSCASKCTSNPKLLKHVEALKNYFVKIREQLRLGNVGIADAMKIKALDYVADNIIVPLVKQKGDDAAMEEAGEIINSLIRKDFSFDQKFVEYINR